MRALSCLLAALLAAAPAAAAPDAPERRAAIEAAPGRLTVSAPYLQARADWPDLAGLPRLEAHLGEQVRDRLEVYLADARAAAAEHARAPEPRLPWRAWTAEQSWRIVWRDGDLVSVRLDWSDYTGGAHPNRGFDAVLWDEAAGAPVPLSALFADLSPGSPAFERIREALIEAALAAKAERVAGLDRADERVRLAARLAGPDDLPAFTLRPAEGAGAEIAALAFHFGPYDIGAYAEGPYHLAVEAATLAPHLAPGWRARLAEPAEAPR